MLDIADRYADGAAAWGEIVSAYCDVNGLLRRRCPTQEHWAFALVAILRATSAGDCFYGGDWEYDRYDARLCALDVVDYAAWVAAWAGRNREYILGMDDKEARFLRCLVGPLAFRPVTLDPHCLTAGVVILAQTVYENRAFKHLPILADALEEAGCKNPEILAHCRQPGEHVRGCWVVDLMLGKDSECQ